MSQPKSIAAPASAEKAPLKGKNAIPDELFKLIIERGVADKLNPKATGKVYFQLARHAEEHKNYVVVQ